MSTQFVQSGSAMRQTHAGKQTSAPVTGANPRGIPSRSLLPHRVVQSKCAGGEPAGLFGPYATCEGEQREATGQRRTTGSSKPRSVPPIVHDVLESPGQSLDARTRAFMEPQFGHDFSRVRVHADAKAAESARAVGALAYTVGREVVFGEGQYHPDTGGGKRLLAHELTHVVQQTNGFQAELAINQPGDRYEQEADHTALAIIRGAPSPVYGQTGAGVVRRLMRQETGKPKTAEEAGPNVMEPRAENGETAKYKLLSSDIKALKNFKISGSITSVIPDATAVSTAIPKLHSVVDRMQGVDISEKDIKDINLKISELNSKIDFMRPQAAVVPVASPGVVSGLVVVLEAIGAIIAAILELPILVIITVAALVVLVLWAVYEIIQAILEAADELTRCIELCYRILERPKPRKDSGLNKGEFDKCLAACRYSNAGE